MECREIITRKVEESVLSSIHPYEAAVAMFMGLHSRLGQDSKLKVLDEDVIKEISELYRSWFWTRPWIPGEASGAEGRWLKGRDVKELAKDLGRHEDDVRIMLGIIDTQFSESKVREFERAIMKGFIICDVENYGGIVQRTRTSIMPGNYGVPGKSEEIGHFVELPSRIRRKLVIGRAVHDPENLLGYGCLSLTAMP